MYLSINFLLTGSCIRSSIHTLTSEVRDLVALTIISAIDHFKNLTFVNDVYTKMVQMDNVISHAQATLGTLMSQWSTFGGITMEIRTLAADSLRYLQHIFFSCSQTFISKSIAQKS